MTKDPARVAAGKRAWAKKTPAQKAAVRARLRRVRPNKGGGGKGKSKPKGKALTASNPDTKAATATNNKKKPRAGATYQALKVTAQAAVPLTDYALIPGRKTVNGLMAHVKSRANLELGKGYGVAAVDFALSKHRFVRHANALSRLSVTALAPEAYLALKSYEDAMAKKPARSVHSNAAATTMAYDPQRGVFTGAGFGRTRTYHKLKWIGAGVRLVANRTRIGRAITRPIRENVLRELGGSI